MARRSNSPAVSVIVPVLNDAAPLRRLLQDLQDTASLEVVVVDGGSDDDSLIVAGAADRVGSAHQGRGSQLQAGVSMSRADWLWFVHADSRLPGGLAEALVGRLNGVGWGFLPVRIDGQSPVYRVIENAMNWRSAATGIATGDQGIFVHRKLLSAIGGVPRQSLMEDVELCRRLRRLSKPRRLPTRLVTSSRRWEQQGVVRTVVLMWWLRLRYFLGADADTLARRYYG